MGKVDRATKSYLTQSSVFADIFNFYLYEGQQVIDPGQLRELDPAELSMPYGTDRKGEPVQRYRDLFKALSAMEDQRAAYLLLGIEISCWESKARMRFTMRHLCETCSTMRCSTQGRWRRQPETIGSRRITEDGTGESSCPVSIGRISFFP